MELCKVLLQGTPPPPAPGLAMGARCRCTCPFPPSKCTCPTAPHPPPHAFTDFERWVHVQFYGYETRFGANCCAWWERCLIHGSLMATYALGVYGCWMLGSHTWGLAQLIASFL